MDSLNGLLLVDKPSGPTSHDIVDRVRRALGIRAVGHAGTLDPFASGLLILGIGKGTKSLTALVGHDKTYEIEARLGQRTDTFDREGQPVSEPYQGEPPTKEQIEAILPRFRGILQQKAPLYSAIKRQGKKLYELARAGTATEEMRPTREVVVHELELLEYVWPTLKLRARVSSGTYIRSLVDDIGAGLGTGAFVKELRRTKVGEFEAERAVSIATLTKERVEQSLIR